MRRKNKRVLLHNRKAGFKLSWEELGEIILAIGILLPLLYVGTVFMKGFISDEAEATERNFDVLAQQIKNTEAEKLLYTDYPLFVKRDYAIVGYPSGISRIGGVCTAYGYGLTAPATYVNAKPLLCGASDAGCLCLCKKNDFEKLCQDSEEVVDCRGLKYFKEDLSFTGGTYMDGNGSCSFALILGEGTQSIAMKRVEDTVHICTQECE